MGEKDSRQLVDGELALFDDAGTDDHVVDVGSDRVLIDLRSPLRPSGPTAPRLVRVVYYAGSYDRWLKPLLDWVAAAVLLIVTAPLMVAASMAIWITMGRPIMFTQPRVGRDGAEFTIYKFRTMLPDRRVQQLPYEGPNRRQNHKAADDPRTTNVGDVLRKYSLDELPQLWNVLKGDMSLVGPRPEMPEIVSQYQGWQHDRHQVKPGLTGIWQIMARSNGTVMHEATEHDIRYIQEISPRTDLRILLRTIPAALGKRKGF